MKFFVTWRETKNTYEHSKLTKLIVYKFPQIIYMTGMDAWVPMLLILLPTRIHSP